jgi:hypothetical protein
MPSPWILFAGFAFAAIGAAAKLASGSTSKSVIVMYRGLDGAAMPLPSPARRAAHLNQ